MTLTKQLSAMSTGHTDRDLAVMTVSRWFVEGLPQTKGKPKRQVTEAISINRLFTIIGEIDISNIEADRILSILKQRGLLKKIKEAEERDFITYLLDFYDYDTSPYIREKLAHGQSFGRTHCKDSIGKIKSYWKSISKGEPFPASPEKI